MAFINREIFVLGKNLLQRLACLWFGLLMLNWNVSLTHADWPQASGPDGNFQIAGEAVTEFSVSLGKNVKWKAPLPSTGQGGVVVVGDRILSHPMKKSTQIRSLVLGSLGSASTPAMVKSYGEGRYPVFVRRICPVFSTIQPQHQSQISGTLCLSMSEVACRGLITAAN